ncbi:hypothetical protein [Jatrophihabitans fulvus]
MEPQLPVGPQEPDVGAFRQGDPFSRWALSRFVVGRVVLQRVSWTLLGLAVVLLALAVVCQLVLHLTVVTVLLVLVMLGVLAMRALLRFVLNRVMAAAEHGELGTQLHEVVDGAAPEVLAELRRVGLPSRTATLPLLALRLLRARRREDTLARLRRFDVERAVSQARVDQLHLLLQRAGAVR